MWSPPFTQEPVEKIRKAQWTVENTRETQKVVDELVDQYAAAMKVFGHRNSLCYALKMAVLRFKQLDPAVTFPEFT